MAVPAVVPGAGGALAVPGGCLQCQVQLRPCRGLVLGCCPPSFGSTASPLFSPSRSAVTSPPVCTDFGGPGPPLCILGGAWLSPPNHVGLSCPPQVGGWGQLVCHRGCFLVTPGDTLSLRLPPRVPPCPPAPHGLPSPVGCGRVTSLPPLSPRPAPPAPSGTPQRCPVTPIKFFCHSSPHPWGHGGWGGPRGARVLTVAGPCAATAPGCAAGSPACVQRANIIFLP